MSDSRHGYRELTGKLKVFIDAASGLDSSVFKPDEVAARREVLNLRKAHIENQDFFVAVVGEMKYGKSTFLNAMLGKPVFAVDVNEATAAITFLRHNELIKDVHPDWVDKAVVEYVDGREPLVVDHLELSKYTTCLEKGELNVAEDVRKVTIYSDCKFVKDRVSVVDTPGTNTTSRRHEEITYFQINQSNAAIFLFRASAPGVASDYKFLGDVAKKINQFFFVVNRIDEVPAKDAPRAVDSIKNKMRECPAIANLVDKMKFFPTSGLEALLARSPVFFTNVKYETEDKWRSACGTEVQKDAFLQRSGMRAFEDALMTFLFRGDRTREFLKSQLTFVYAHVGEAKSRLDGIRSVLENNVKVEDLERKKKTLELDREKGMAQLQALSDELAEKLAEALKDALDTAKVEAGNIKTEFKERLDSITDIQALQNALDELRGDVVDIPVRFASRKQLELEEVAADVFRSTDYRLRSELKKGLGTSAILRMSDFRPDEVKCSAYEESSQISEVQADIKQMEEQLAAYDVEIRARQESAGELVAARAIHDRIKNELKEKRADLNRREQQLGTRPGVQTVMTKEERDEKEWRGGILGFLGNVCFGRRTVHRPAEYRQDSSARDEYDRDLANLKTERDKTLQQIEDRLAKAGDALTKAEKDKIKAQGVERMEAQLRARHADLRQTLVKAQADEEVRYVQANKSILSRALTINLDRTIEQVQRVISKCKGWAGDYIQDAQARLNDAMAKSSADIAEIERLLSETTSERQKLAETVGEADRAYSKLMSDYDVLNQDIDKFCVPKED